MEKSKEYEVADERVVKVEIPNTVLTGLLNRAYDERKAGGKDLEGFQLVYVDLFYMPPGKTVGGEEVSELRFLYKRER